MKKDMFEVEIKIGDLVMYPDKYASERVIRFGRIQKETAKQFGFTTVEKTESGKIRESKNLYQLRNYKNAIVANEMIKKHLGE